MSLSIDAQVRAGASSACIGLALLCLVEAGFYVLSRLLFRRSFRIVVPASRASSTFTAIIGALPLLMFALTRSAARASATSVLVTAALHPVSPAPERAIGVVAVRAASVLNVRATSVLCFLASLGRLRKFRKVEHLVLVLTIFVYFT